MQEDVYYRTNLLSEEKCSGMVHRALCHCGLAERRSLHLVERVLRTFAVLALVSSCVVFVLTIVQLSKDTPASRWSREISIMDRFREARDRGEAMNPQGTGGSPLVREAEAFASYLNPPRQQVEKSKSAVAASNSSRTTYIPSPEPVRLTPQFKLAGTSYYRLKPEESMALVWEPGTGYRWIKQGARLGHFVVAEIEPGRIAYLDGHVRGEMQVETELPGDLRRADVVASASSQTSESPVRSSILPIQSTKTGELSSPNREARSIAQ